MAGYNYMSRGGGYTDDRNKISYGGENVYCDDHVCRPVIVDAEGRKRPIISYSSPESYVTTSAERIIEHARAPIVVTEYQKYTSQAQVEAVKEYGIVSGDKWPRSSSPVYDRRYSSPPKVLEPVRPTYGVPSGNRQDRPPKVEDFITKVQTEVSRPYDRRYSSPPKVQEPVRTTYGVTSDNWQDRPPKVEDYITKVQPEVSRPITRPGLLSATHWRNPPNSTGQGGTNGYGGGPYANSNNNTTNDYGGGEYPNYNNNNNNWNKQPNDGNSWERSGQNGWTTPPSQNAPLSGPTNDIGKAVEILKDAVKPSSIAATALQSRFGVPASTVPKRDTNYADTIDSKEAAKRYGNFNMSSRPQF